MNCQKPCGAEGAEIFFDFCTGPCTCFQLPPCTLFFLLNGRGKPMTYEFSIALPRRRRGENFFEVWHRFLRLFPPRTEKQFCAGVAEKNAFTPHHSLETFAIGVGPHNAVALANFLEIIFHKKIKFQKKEYIYFEKTIETQREPVQKKNKFQKKKKFFWEKNN